MATTPILGAGSEVGPYRIESLLGRGGMGVVYLARDPRLDRPVALKLLTPELAGDERFRERFERESRLAASIDHAGIVPVYEAGDADGVTYIAMRYVEGSDLGQLLRAEAPLEPARALELVGQLAHALDAAHAARADPPRRQAEQRAGGARGPRLPGRLRPDEDRRPGSGRRGRGDGRHGRLPGSGGDPRRGADAGLRPLRARLRALRVPVGRRPVSRAGAPRP